MTVDAPHPTTPLRAWNLRSDVRSTRGFLAAIAALVVLLGGCGLRMETPPPTEPVPDATEELRETAVFDALDVQQTATAALAAVTDPAVAALLTQIADFAMLHVTALGGVYDSGLEGFVTSAPTASPEPPATATPEDAVLALVGAAGRAQSAVDMVQDGAAARLLASIATSETLSAQRLATHIGSTSADPLTPPPSSVAQLPSGVGASELSAIVTGEDGTGYALEVQAAAAEGDQRAALLTAALTHRALANQWAEAAELATTDQDPRRVAYSTPQGLETPVLVQQLNASLATSYASLVAEAAAGSRATVSGLLLRSTTEQMAWGGEPSAFPGLPEQASD